MNKNNKIIISILAVIAMVAVLFGVYKAFGPEAETGTKEYTVTVTGADGSFKSYEGNTDAEYLRALMEELQEEEDFSYSGDESEYGLYITAINGEIADGNEGAYWMIYVNGEYGQYGVDSQPVTDGDVFSFVYEVYTAQ